MGGCAMSSDVLNFYLPDFYTNVNLFCFFHDMQQSAPSCFYDDVKITSAYGSFPNCIWNGGRVILDRVSKDMIEAVLKQYRDRGIKVRFTFTNPLIEEKHLADHFCNMVMELADHAGNEVLVNAPVLEQYIREKYPDYALISSTTKCLNDFERIKEELEKDYSLVVLDSALNNTPEIFSMDHRDRVELIVNHYCADNCPRRKMHYNVIGKAQLEYSNTPPDWQCNNVNREFFRVMENRSFISTELMFGKYREAGFRHFKLDGRGFPAHRLIAALLYYFVKPQWHDQFWQIILREIYKI